MGDIVYLTGEIYQFKGPLEHLKALEYIKRGDRLPFNLEGAIIGHLFHSATKIRDKWKLNYLGATTSAVVNRFTPDFIRIFKVRVLAGKGGMDNATLKAMGEVGCVYLALCGGCSAYYTARVKGIKAVYWEELGPSKVSVFEVQNFGPLFVGMDSYGKSLFNQATSKATKMLTKMKKM